MATPIENRPLSDFRYLADNISLYQPTRSTQQSHSASSNGPQSVIFCAWFRALPKHIEKYTATYQSHYPNAQILLITSWPKDMLFTSHKQQQANLQPAVDVLKAANATDQRIFLHAFSNGGCNSTVQLAKAWRNGTDTPLPICAMALDSSPGSSSLSLAAAAIILSFPKSYRLLAAIFVWTIIIPIFALPELLGGPNLVEAFRASLNDGTLFKKDVPRVYLYSKADEMVPAASVEDHCASAWEVGYKAKLVRFQRSPHVAHVNENKERYWQAIEATVTTT